MNIDKAIKDRKMELLSYFRNRASEALTDIKVRFAETQSDKRARAINESLNQTKFVLITTLLQQAEKDKWTNQEKLECILMITYCNIVVMIRVGILSDHMNIWTSHVELANCGTHFVSYAFTIQSTVFRFLYHHFFQKSKRK